MESLRDVKRAMEREVKKGSCPLMFDRLEFSSKPFQMITLEEKLDEVLAYLTDLIAYLMDGGGMPYFTDWERENALDEALYQVYENGEIAFAIDPDVYEDGLEEMLSGTLSFEEYRKKTESKLKMYWGE